MLACTPFLFFSSNGDIEHNDAIAITSSSICNPVFGQQHADVLRPSARSSHSLVSSTSLARRRRVLAYVTPTAMVPPTINLHLAKFQSEDIGNNRVAYDHHAQRDTEFGTQVCYISVSKCIQVTFRGVHVHTPALCLRCPVPLFARYSHATASHCF